MFATLIVTLLVSLQYGGGHPQLRPPFPRLVIRSVGEPCLSLQWNAKQQKYVIVRIPNCVPKHIPPGEGGEVS